MADFSKYYPKLLQYEGGYASPAYAAKMGDSGGETYCGIARNYNQKWEGWKIIDAYKAKNGEPAYNSRIPDPKLYQLAMAHTKKAYWDKMQLDGVTNQSLGEFICDFGFNSGLNTSINCALVFLQRPLDGSFDSIDIAAINNLSDDPTKEASKAGLFKWMQGYRNNLITKSSKINPKFKDGLLARSNSFKFKP